MNLNIMRKAGFGEEMDAVEKGNCPFCFKPINMDDFRDDESIAEYNISGICQSCQDQTYYGEIQ